MLAEQSSARRVATGVRFASCEAGAAGAAVASFVEDLGFFELSIAEGGNKRGRCRNPTRAAHASLKDESGPGGSLKSMVARCSTAGPRGRPLADASERLP